MGDFLDLLKYVDVCVICPVVTTMDTRMRQRTWQAAVVAPLFRNERRCSTVLQRSASASAMTPADVRPLDSRLSARSVLLECSVAAIAEAPSLPILQAVCFLNFYPD